MEAAEGPRDPRISTGTACNLRSVPIRLSSSRLCFNVMIDIDAWVVHLLPSQTSHVALLSSGNVGGSQWSLNHPRGLPLSEVVLMYQLFADKKNSIHLFGSPFFRYTTHPLQISSVGSYIPLIDRSCVPLAPRISIDDTPGIYMITSDKIYSIMMYKVLPLWLSSYSSSLWILT